jgi:predicted TIM-barrel enzyme
MVTMQNNRRKILKKLMAQIHVKEHIIAVASGSGMSAKYCTRGGADLILALSAGRFRQTGRASLASYLCFGNSNAIVRDFAARELIPLIWDIPILFGLNASDPSIDPEEYIGQIRNMGFAGIVNFPTVGLIDGQFREALEEAGLGFENEIEAIRIAHQQDLFTLAFVFDEWQAQQMLEAGADIICAHLGWTTGGALGAKRAHSIEIARQMADRVFAVCQKSGREVIKMIYGGPIKSPTDAQYFYDNTDCQGFIGGSSFERIPIEKAIEHTTRTFKSPQNKESEKVLLQVLAGRAQDYDDVEFVQNHIEENYAHPIFLSELANVLHISAPYLSAKFKKKLGCSFSEYLVRFRMNKAASLLGEESMLTISEIADSVGYTDYAQFSKIFKKYKGVSPRTYRKAAAQGRMPDVENKQESYITTRII